MDWAAVGWGCCVSRNGTGILRAPYTRLQTRLYHEHEIPWSEYAFPTGEAALRFFLAHRHDAAVDCATITRMPPKPPHHAAAATPAAKSS